MPLKTLIIKPRSGLGNRLRAIASARRLSQIHGLTCCITWDWGDPSLIIETHGMMVLAQPPSDVHTIRHQIGSPRLYLDIKNLPAEVIVDSNQVFGCVEASGENESVSESKVAAWLPLPSPFIHRHVEAITRTTAWQNDTLGVHVRAPDLDIENPMPLASLWNLYHPHMKDWKGSIFLCSNDARIERQAASEFGPRFVSRPKASVYAFSRWPRNRLNSTAVVEDMIDMMLLSHCQNMIGASWSSFSRIAAEYGRPCIRRLSLLKKPDSDDKNQPVE